MENTTFTYRYSAEKMTEVEKIRSKYLPKKENKIERLRKLDNKVQTAGTVESLIIGILGSLVFGIGMCYGLDVFEGADWLTLLFGGIGVLMMLPAKEIHSRIARKTKAALTPEIIRISNEIIGE